MSMVFRKRHEKKPMLRPEINSKIINCWFNHRVYGREANSQIQGDVIEPAVLNVKHKSALQLTRSPYTIIT
jgi:hypothetical protein